MSGAFVRPPKFAFSGVNHCGIRHSFCTILDSHTFPDRP